MPGAKSGCPMKGEIRVARIKFCMAKKFVCIMLLFTMISCSVSALSIGKDTSIRSMDEYERIIGSAVLPENFVPYERCKCWDNWRDWYYIIKSKKIMTLSVILSVRITLDIHSRMQMGWSVGGI